MTTSATDYLTKETPHIMNEQLQAPLNEIGGDKRRRVVVGVFVAGIATLLAAPAALAAVWSINEVESNFELTDCLNKTEGADSTNFSTDPLDDYYIDFDAAATETDSDTGVAVLQEVLTVKAPAGFRTYSTDTFHVNAATCGYNFTVNLTSLDPNSFGEAATAGNWADKGVKIYLSEVASPGDDFSVAADWDQTPLIVNDTGALANATTGDAVLADDSNLVIGFELVGGSPAGLAGTLRFQVNFTPVP